MPAIPGCLSDAASPLGPPSPCFKEALRLSLSLSLSLSQHVEIKSVKCGTKSGLGGYAKTGAQEVLQA